MTRSELEAALARCEGHTPEGWVDDLGDIRESAEGPIIATVWNHVTPKRTNADAALIRLAPSLASALREAWEEIDRLAQSVEVMSNNLYERSKETTRLKSTLNDLRIQLSDATLDEALNAGDGSYKP